jgi:hypothetical protein
MKGCVYVEQGSEMNVSQSETVAATVPGRGWWRLIAGRDRGRREGGVKGTESNHDWKGKRRWNKAGEKEEINTETENKWQTEECV